MSFLDKLFTAGIASALKTPTSSIDVSTTEPVEEYVLKVQGGKAVWAEAQGGPVVGSRDFLLAPPDEDDEWDLVAAKLTDPDLGNAGWTIRTVDSPWTTLTRGGEIDRALTGVPAAGTYQSSLVNGRLLVRLPNASSCTFSKPTSGNHIYKAHVGKANWDGNTSNIIFVAAGNQPGNTGSDIAYAGRENGNVLGFLWTPPSTFAQAFSVSDAASELNQERVLYMADAGTGARNIDVRMLYPDGVFFRASLTPISASFTTACAGVMLASGNANGPNWFYIDQVRRLPPNTLL